MKSIQKYDVIIIGAGPAGCRTAELISKHDYKVLIIEEHKTIGEPVQCAGLISWRLKQMLRELPESMIINTVKNAKFFSSFTSLNLTSDKPVYVINRARLDKYLYNRAKKKAEVRLGVRFINFKRTKNSIKVKTTRGIFETKLLVGADGPNSMVAKQARLKHPKNKLVGVQTTVSGDFDEDSVELWFKEGISPEFFGWVIP